MLYRLFHAFYYFCAEEYLTLYRGFAIISGGSRFSLRGGGGLT